MTRRPKKKKPSPKSKRNANLTTTLKVLGIVFAVPVVLIVLLYLINIFDEERNPEIVAFVDFSNETVPPAQNAYFARMGHDAPQGTDPHMKGREIVDRHNQRANEVVGENAPFVDVRDEVLGPKKIVFRGKIREICPPDTAPCLKTYASHASEIRRLLNDNRTLMSRYARYYGYPHYRETNQDAINFIFATSDANSYFLNRASIGLRAHNGQTHAALIELQRDTRFWRLVMAESRTLFSKMLAVNNVRRNMQLLSEIIDARPLSAGDAKIARAIVAPFSEAEFDFERPVRDQFSYIQTVLDRVSASSLLGESDSTWWDFAARPLFQKNATLNFEYDRFSRMANLSRASFPELKDRMSYENLEKEFAAPGMGLHSVYNPVGKVLASMSGVDGITNYLVRIRNLEPLRRLVLLQLSVRERGIASGKLEKFLAASRDAFKNPYNGEPAVWDAQNRSLYLMSLSERGSPDVLGRRVEVFVGK